MIANRTFSLSRFFDRGCVNYYFSTLLSMGQRQEYRIRGNLSFLIKVGTSNWFFILVVALLFSEVCIYSTTWWCHHKSTLWPSSPTRSPYGSIWGWFCRGPNIHHESHLGCGCWCLQGWPTNLVHRCTEQLELQLHSRRTVGASAEKKRSTVKPIDKKNLVYRSLTVLVDISETYQL